ncbi:MAG: septal ring lytic transglycosylase RlpA family protein [Pseudomonas neustonica]
MNYQVGNRCLRDGLQTLTQSDYESSVCRQARCVAVWLSVKAITSALNKVAYILKYLALLSLLLLAGCSTTQLGAAGDWAGYKESGQASFYADKHQNQRTASGALYRHDLSTAAHKKLPFGSVVKVTNTSNGKSVVVTINDRGPFVRGRVIDLSKSAFSRIGDTASGLLNVEIEVIR